MLKQLTSCKQSKRTLCQTEGRTGNLYSPGRQIYRNDVRVRHSTYVFIDLHNYYVLLYIVKLVTRDHRKITTNFHTLTREACKLCKTSVSFPEIHSLFFHDWNLSMRSLKDRLGVRVGERSGALVMGLTGMSPLRSHSSIAPRSYEYPSAAITGSRIISWVMGHKYSSGVSASPLPWNAK